MKSTLTKVATVIATLWIAISLAGCSSQTNEEPELPVHGDPDTAFKGEINDDLLTKLSDGKLISTIYANTAEIYSKSIDANGNTADEWSFIETEGFPPSANHYKLSRFNYMYLYVKDGQTWLYGTKYRTFGPHLSLIFGIWGNFAWKFQLKDMYGYKGNFIYDKSQNKLTINGNTFNVECCDDDQLVLSYEETTDTDDLGRDIPLQRFKYVFFCRIRDTCRIESLGMESILAETTMFESQTELKIHMIKTMREYIGDVFDPEKYSNFGIKSKIDLARYEENLRNGLPDELYRDYSNYWNPN